MSNYTLLMLGNGYDLAHCFPTKYDNFLHVINFLSTSYNESFDTVGKILGNEELQNSSPFLKSCYQKHKYIYDSTPLNRDKAARLIEGAKTNTWFKYFLSSFNRELGWIDFEKEISIVIEAFEYFFDTCSIKFNMPELKIKNQHIISKFDFFHESNVPSKGLPAYTRRVKKKYTIEHPQGSGYLIVFKEEIVKGLYLELLQLANMLQLYLTCFVDNPSHVTMEQGLRTTKNIFQNVFQVFTFNYTQTYEILYGCDSSVLHIHGDTKKNIVLGVNPNSHDELIDLDTSFIKFKKYFQRIFYRTDLNYTHKLKHLREQKKYDSQYTLYVFGHSLNETDKDIIKDLFDLADQIVIFYHNLDAVSSYITNLVNIYGKQEFDQLRVNKNLYFLDNLDINWRE